jgi:hypothetical protein
MGPLRNQLLFVVFSNDFVKFKVVVTRHCKGTITVKKRVTTSKCLVSFTSNGSDVTPLLHKSNLSTTVY